MVGKGRIYKQKKRWEDITIKWTGVDFASSTRAAAESTRWKEIVVKVD